MPSLRRSTRSLFALFMMTGTALGIGCGLGSDEAADDGGQPTASVEPIIDLAHTWVRRQTIGNCWLYATASWAEALNKALLPADAPMPDGAVTSVIIPADAGDAGYTGPEPWRPAGLNMSESYWTYWHWFDQLANGGNTDDAIETGGFFVTAAEIINRYGVMKEVDFIPSENWFESSPTQKRALATINESMKTGVLKNFVARRDRALVRSELDRAFGLSPNVVAAMDQVFGRTVSRTLDRSNVATKGTNIIRAREIAVQLRDPSTRRVVTRTLQDAVGTRAANGMRLGSFAWNVARYPFSPAQRRDTLIRVQRAMHDHQPVIVTWRVDFNAGDPEGRFLAPPEEPGSQGGHMVVVEDYQINNVPGFGTLLAGQVETRQQALTAALSPTAKVEFIRVKNSWGTSREVQTLVPGGYNDLYMKYLDGPAKNCVQNAEGTDSTDQCFDGTPLEHFILPPGY
jgi:hypothetical protein